MAKSKKTITATRLKSSMPALAQPTAEFWNSVFNIVLVLGAIAVLAGTWGVFWTGNMKEFYSNARISANEAETAKANAAAAAASRDAAELQVRSRELERQAAEARLHQEELHQSNLQLQQQIAENKSATDKIQGDLAPRKLSPTQGQAIKGAIMSSDAQNSPVRAVIIGGQEAQNYGKEIVDALKGAGITVHTLIIESVSIVGAPHEENPSIGIHVSPQCNPVVRKALEAAGIKVSLSLFIPRGNELSIGPKE